MSFVVYDLSFLVVFSIAVCIFLYVRRKKLKREGPMFLYKTKIGLKAIDYLGKKFPRTMKFLSYLSVFTGYILMIIMVYMLWQILYLFLKPEFVRMVKIPPIMPIIPYLPTIFKVDWLPPFYFTYWILALAIVAIVHEGSHGIFARFYNVKIKSTGFGFLGPFLAFFVEQDDKQMTKKKIFPQLSILSAGVFANVIVGFLFLIVMVGFSNMAYAPAGAIYNDYAYSMGNYSYLAYSNITNETLKVDGISLVKVKFTNMSFYVFEDYFKFNESQIKEDPQIKFYYDLPAINSGMKGAIIEINGKEIKTYKDAKILDNYKPGDAINIKTRDILNKSKPVYSYNLVLGRDYDNSSRAVIGTAVVISQSSTTLGKIIIGLASDFREPYTYYAPRGNEELTIFIYNLFWWILIINLSLALSNMLPAFIFDGGRFWYLTVLAITRREKVAEKVFKIFTWLLLLFFAFLMLLWLRGILRI